jgi:glutaredoxin 3
MLTIYSKENCPFCTRAKSLLDEKGVKYTDIRVDLLPEAKQFVLDAGHRSVPQIYKDGKLFVENGYAGLAKLNDLDFQQLKENV